MEGVNILREGSEDYFSLEKVPTNNSYSDFLHSRFQLEI